jgi:hypothetical protein
MKKQTGYCIVKSLLAGALLLGATAVPSWAASGVPALGPVFVIIGENAPLSQLNKNTAPYLLGTLAPASAWLTNYWGTTHYLEAN